MVAMAVLLLLLRGKVLARERSILILITRLNLKKKTLSQKAFQYQIFQSLIICSHPPSPKKMDLSLAITVKLTNSVFKIILSCKNTPIKIIKWHPLPIFWKPLVLQWSPRELTKVSDAVLTLPLSLVTPFALQINKTVNIKQESWQSRLLASLCFLHLKV